jgi:hypothetical protein
VGCTKNINVTVSSGAGPTATVTSTATSCNGAANGTITVSPANGTAPYRFSLDGAPSVAGTIPYTFFNVNSGPHTIVVTDGPGCITGTIPILQRSVQPMYFVMAGLAVQLQWLSLLLVNLLFNIHWMEYPGKTVIVLLD